MKQSWTVPESKVHGANMGPIWGRQDPGGPHVGPMNFAIWGIGMYCMDPKKTDYITAKTVHAYMYMHTVQSARDMGSNDFIERIRYKLINVSLTSAAIFMADTFLMQQVYIAFEHKNSSHFGF